MAITRSATASRVTATERRRAAGQVLRYFFLLLFGFMYVAPFLWMISVALKPFVDLNNIPPNLIPSRFAWENFPDALLQPFLYFPAFAVNTVYYVVLSVLGQLLSSAIVAYGFARIGFRGSTVLFAIVLATMMVPFQVTLIPSYVVYYQLGLLDTYVPLILPSWFGVAFYIFLFRQFFLTIPREIDDAAMIDGANHFQILFQIMVPLSVPAILTCLALSVVERWNDFYGPLIYINTNAKQVLAVALTYFNVPNQATYQNLLMAAAVVTVIPMIILFLLLQDYFTQGVTMTGLREG
jgi:multiple sugar transport system permease protein